jgi:hypothetical protein
MSDENIGDKDVRRKSNPTSSDRKKKLHRLLASSSSSSSSSSEEFERQSHTVEEGHDYITYDSLLVENNFTPIKSEIALDKRYNDFDIVEADYRPFIPTDKFANADVTIKLLCPNSKSGLINRYIARHLLPHQVEGVKWLWSKYSSREGAILGYYYIVTQNFEHQQFFLSKLTNFYFEINLGMVSYLSILYCTQFSSKNLFICNCMQTWEWVKHCRYDLSTIMT